MSEHDRRDLWPNVTLAMTPDHTSRRSRRHPRNMWLDVAPTVTQGHKLRQLEVRGA